MSGREQEGTGEDGQEEKEEARGTVEAEDRRGREEEAEEEDEQERKTVEEEGHPRRREVSERQTEGTGRRGEGDFVCFIA